MIVSTDMAHNLGDLFQVNIKKEIISVAKNLDVYEIDPTFVMENDYADITKCIINMIPDRGELDMSDFGMIPGTEELFSLLKISDIYKSGKYENIMVDCAPTGETLSLLKFPELLSWYMEKLLPIGKLAMRVMSPISKKVFHIALPDKVAMNDIESIPVIQK